MIKKHAFSLAEVLITLGIIGIVAALTIPTLVLGYKKRIVTTRMLKFYSSMKQATTIAAQEGVFTDMPAEIDSTADEIFDWFNKYFSKYLKIQSLEKISDGIIGSLADGSGFIIIYNGHTVFCPEYKKCEEALENANNSGFTLFVSKLDGKNTFSFSISKTQGIFKTYDVCWGGTREDAISNANPSCDYAQKYQYGCADLHKLCSKLIEIDGWKIADDYPVKF